MRRREFLRGAGLAGGAVCMLNSKVLWGEEGQGQPLVRFGMVTDLHYADIPMGAADAPIGNRHYRESCKKLREAVNTMNSVKPDFMIELGDFKDLSPDKERTVACLDEIEAVFAGFKGDRYHVLGNHDFDCLSKAEFLSHIRNSGQDKTLPHYSFVKNGVTCVVLDACYNGKMEDYRPGNWTWTVANVPPKELDWLKETLAKAQGPAIVFCHQRLDPNAEINHEVRNSKAVRALFKESGKVKAVFTGHEHYGGTCELDGIPYYSLRALVVGTGETFNSYAVGELYADGKVCVKGYRKAVDFVHDR